MRSLASRLPVALLCLLAGCPSSEHSPSGVVGITADDSTLEAFDETTQLHAAEFDSEGKPLPSEGFAWSSSDPGIASVDADGLVTAHGNGTAVIRAVSERGFAGTTDILVEQVAVAIEITPEDWPTAQAWIGARRQFAAEAVDANDYPIAGADVTWTSSNDSDVVIDDDGLATAMDDGANVQLIAATGSVSDSLLVTVVNDGSLGPGLMFTMWYARSDDAPAVLANGRIFVPDNVIFALNRTDPTPPWPHNRPTVAKFQWEGDRVAILTDVADGSGTFRVRDRIGEWANLVIADAADFQLENNRIGVLKRDGELRTKDGTAGNWTILIPSGAASFQLYQSRIGVVMDSGEFRVKDALNDPWTVLVAAGTGTPRFQLYGNRIAVLLANGTLRVKDGIDGQWTDIATNVIDFQIWDNRIAWTDASGNFRVQDGPAGSPTTLATEPLAQFQLQGDRIGIHFESGLFRVKDGIHGGWTNMADSDVREFQLQGNLIGIIRDSDGALLVKFGPTDDEWNPNPPTFGANVAQFRLLVDVPSPPFRTTPASYASEQARCETYPENPEDTPDDPNDEENDCYPSFASRPIAPFYGLFCGAGRPFEFGDAIADGAIDSMDHVCWHHDMADTWYPETPNDLTDDAAACIVRYGLRHGRLTEDGVILTHGYETEEEWLEAWVGVGMENLKGALHAYFGRTELCSEADLAWFTSATASQH